MATAAVAVIMTTNANKDLGILKFAVILCVLLQASLAVGSTVDQLRLLVSQHLGWMFSFCGMVFLVEFFYRAGFIKFRSVSALPPKELSSYLVSFMGIIDIVALTPPILWWFAWDMTKLAAVASVIAMLKLSRYISALELLATVLRNEAKTLWACLFSILILQLITATGLYVFESESQPELFSSIPQAMWWSIVTITTTGYGDMSPTSTLGRIFGGMTMLLGIGLLAVPTAIIASGFSDELRRRERLNFWNLISHIPLFKELDASVIGDLSSNMRLHNVPAHVVLFREGGFPDALFVISEGEVEVCLSDKPIRLGAGSFFGESALLEDSRRNATVVTTKPSRLLILEVTDFQSISRRHPEFLARVRAKHLDRKARLET